MPSTEYDAKKVRDLLTFLPSLERDPAYDFMKEMAEQLKLAETQITTERELRSRSESDANRYAADLETAQQTIRRMREASAPAPVATPAPEAKPKKPRAPRVKASAEVKP